MKEERLLSAMEHIAGELILEAKEAPMKEKKIKSRPLRLVLIAAVLVALFAVTVTAAYVIKEWDSVFANRFQPTEAIQEQMNGNLDQPEASATRDGVTLSVRQTICDGNELYAVVELLLPEDFDMDYLKVEPNGMSDETLSLFATKDETTGNWYTGPATERAEWFQGTLSEEELETLTEEKIEEDSFHYYIEVGMGGGSFLPKYIDAQTRTISYLLMMEYDEETGGPVTIWFENIYYSSTEEGLLSGPIYMSWTPEYNTEPLDLTLEQDGENVGAVTLTPMSIQVDVPELLDVLENPPEEGTEAYDELVDRICHEQNYFEELVTVTIHFADGSQRDIVYGFGGGYDDETGGLSLSLDADFGIEFLDLSTVTAVTVGAITVEVN